MNYLLIFLLNFLLSFNGPRTGGDVKPGTFINSSTAAYEQEAAAGDIVDIERKAGGPKYTGRNN